MFATKVTISKETMERNQLNKRQQGQLRYKRLQELEQSGELSNASTRNELAQLVGYKKGDKTGISWVNNMVHRGYISESLTGRRGATVLKEFHLTSKVPDYDFSQARSTRKKIKTLQPAEPAIPARTFVEPTRGKVTIEYCGMVVVLENVPADYVGEIIKTIK